MGFQVPCTDTLIHWALSKAREWISKGSDHAVLPVWGQLETSSPQMWPMASTSVSPGTFQKCYNLRLHLDLQNQRQLFNIIPGGLYER